MTLTGLWATGRDARTTLTMKPTAIWSRGAFAVTVSFTISAFSGTVISLSYPIRPVEKRIRLEASGNEATLIARTVEIPWSGEAEEEDDDNNRDNHSTGHWAITVWEWKNPSSIVEEYWDRTTGTGAGAAAAVEATSTKSQQRDIDTISPLDPFGLVSWPGSVRAAQELRYHQEVAVKNQTILILGCGVGVEVQASINLGARHVIATDIHPSCLQQTRFGVVENSSMMKIMAGRCGTTRQHKEYLQDVLTTQIFDIAASSDEQPLPNGFDTIVIADVLYNEALAKHVCRRVAEAVLTNPSCRILITDSQRFVPCFLQDLNHQLHFVWDTLHPNEPYAPTSWKNTTQSFTGSGVIIDEDQTYDVIIQSLWIGL